jgi:protein-tyrosine-phosphatase/DNA-binding transcriptional ArsR family regulator
MIGFVAAIGLIGVCVSLLVCKSSDTLNLLQSILIQFVLYFLTMYDLLLQEPLDLLRLLGHDLRWRLVRLLVHSDLRVQELAEQVARPLNLVSYHLAQLRRGALVTERRSSSDGRDIYYSLDLSRLRQLYRQAGVALHPAMVSWSEDGATVPSLALRSSPLKILFLCTHNSARSQMAEALLRQLGETAVEVQSAGNEVSTVHPLAVETMRARGIDISSQQSKHVDVFAGQSFDYVITVCDRMREVCPVFPGSPDQIHWSIADPAAVIGDDAQREAFAAVAAELAVRLRFFLHTLAVRDMC